MNVLDLFSGIGGFSLGLERAGMHTVAFCELDPFCQAVLRKHWPGVPIHGDIRSLHAAAVPAGVDVICGGFPCQDISLAGKGAGLSGERSRLWWEYHRLIEEIRPRYAIIENVSALRSRGLDAVLGSLAAIGFDAEWHCIPAAAVGAPHRRDRIWIVAYADSARCQWQGSTQSAGRLSGALAAWRREAVADAQVYSPGVPDDVCARESVASPSGADVADADLIAWGEGRAGDAPQGPRRRDADRGSIGEAWRTDQWGTEPDVGRVAHGVPARVDRLRALGNAVVPQIPEIIGRAIMRCANG